jgi:ABC-type transport system substrate-binding protein
MRLLVGRPQLIASALDGYATAGSDIFSPYDPNFDSSLHREQDIAQAKSLLKKAGHENLTVQLVTSPVATGTVAMSTVLQQQARAAGVTINLKQVDPTTFFGPNYLHWTFSQDFYNYSPYLAQVAQSMLPTSPFNSPRAGTSSRPSSPRSTRTAPRSVGTRRPGSASRCPTSTSSTSGSSDRQKDPKGPLLWNPPCLPPGSASRRARR